MSEYDYIVKTDGFYGYLIYKDYDKAKSKCDEQTVPARVFTVVTTETHNNYDKLTPITED